MDFIKLDCSLFFLTNVIDFGLIIRYDTAIKQQITKGKHYAISI